MLRNPAPRRDDSWRQVGRRLVEMPLLYVAIVAYTLICCSKDDTGFVTNVQMEGSRLEYWHTARRNLRGVCRRNHGLVCGRASGRATVFHRACASLAAAAAALATSFRLWRQSLRDTKRSFLDKASSSFPSGGQAEESQALASSSLIEGPATASVNPIAGEIDARQEPSRPQATAAGQAKQILSFNVPRQSVACASSAVVDTIMAQECPEILRIMARSGWLIEPVNGERMVFELSSPSITREVALGSVKMPRLRFRTVITESQRREGSYVERCTLDMELLNGEDLIELSIWTPFFSAEQTISAAGSGRWYVGRAGSTLCMAVCGETGMVLAKIPGLQSLMIWLVNFYANKFTVDSLNALAVGAADLDVDEDAAA
eukprot:TRINITY_DN17764_c0_g1_i1.p1 TRINITY_DN17764_c0_g1~~TRINITY_DN17764_c0_g1_i1.p1  ORF type:complete len:374 (+),score=18.87 TRINITY_DN17764_c0_g1_i1:64-1185(+)